jgi:hypothetical protein
MLATTKRYAWRVLIAVVCLWLLYVTSVSIEFQKCVSEKQHEQSRQTSEQYVPEVLRPFVVSAHIETDCFAGFLYDSRDAIAAIATVILAIFTGRLWYATAGLREIAEMQSGDLKASVAVANRTADLAERNLTATERAFVHLKTIVGDPIRDPNQVLRIFTVVFEWENSGTTPTRDLAVNVNWTHQWGDLPGGFLYPYNDAGRTRLFLGPKAISHGGQIDIPRDVIDAVRSGRERVFIWGRADYSDIFEGTRPHFTQFCFTLEVRTIPGAERYGFSLYGNYNRSDEDA